MKIGKKKIILIISAVLVICVIGIGFYTSKLIRQSPKNKYLSKADSLKKDVKTLMIPKEKIKTIQGINDVIALPQDKVVYIKSGTALMIADRKTNKEKVIENITADNGVCSVCSNEKYVVFVQTVTDINKTDNNESRFLKIYNINNDEIKILNEDDVVGSEYESGNSKGMFGEWMKLKDNNIIYSVFNHEGIDFMSYDIDTGKKSMIFKSNFKEHLGALYSFDIDLKKGYMIIASNSTNKQNILVLVDLKNNKKTVLAKSSEKISTSMQYPNIAFQIEDKIHVYNIKTNNDDFLIQCGDYPSNVDINADYIAWNDKKLSIYSIKDKKRYEIDNGWFKDEPDNNGKKIMSGNLLYWQAEGDIKYIDMNDIKK